MADEPAQVETTTPEAEAEEQTPETEVTVSEDAPQETAENTTEESGKGDLRVPLKEERTKRQELETLLNDPQFIARKAQEMGLGSQAAPQVQPADDLEDRIDFKFAMREYPDVAKDPETLAYAATLKDLYPSLSYSQAMQKARDKFASAKAEGVTEGRTKAKTEVDDKLKAQTVSPTQVASTVEDDLTERLQSTDKKVQEDALVELMIKRNKKLGI